MTSTDSQMMSVEFPKARGETHRKFGQRMQRPMKMIFPALSRSVDDLFVDMSYVLHGGP